MKKQRKIIPKRLLCLALSALLLGILPVGVFAVPGSTAAAEYTIVAHGGTIAYADGSAAFGGTAPENAVLTVSFEESQFPDKTFAYWKSADGTEIPQQSFRLLVNRNAAFYPVFKDVAGNFGPWETLIGGSSCNEAPILVRTDSAQGLKEYKLGRSGYHQNLRYERIDDGNHRAVVHVRGYVIEASAGLVPPRWRAASLEKDVGAFRHLGNTSFPSLYRQDVERGPPVIVGCPCAESSGEEEFQCLGVHLFRRDVDRCDAVGPRLGGIQSGNDSEDLLFRSALSVGRF